MHHRMVGLAVLLTLACGGSTEQRQVARDSAAQRAHDSALGASGLPGATGISGAMKVADSAALRRQREDSVATAP